jgi:hypothetical protein
MATSLQIVQHYFPHVETVKDADKEVHVEVLPRDNSNSKVKNHTACAMAVACKRTYQADGVIVAVSVAYIVKGNTAIRYRLPESIAREVVSFDRKGGFAPGTYKMLMPKEKHRIGERQGGEENHDLADPRKNHKRKKADLIHYTDGIRTVLGSKSIS